jgi:hypothetical protein
MSSFEFLSVLISVVVGLGIANLLTGVGRLLHRHNEVRVSVAFLAWILFVFHYMVIYWWTVVFGWQDWQDWNLLYFIFVLTYGIVLYLLSVILFPTDMPKDWNPHTSLMSMRKWFFSLFLFLILIELLDTYLKDHLTEFSNLYLLLLATWLAGGIVGWFSENRRTHAVAAVVVLGSQIAWVAYQLSDLE